MNNINAKPHNDQADRPTVSGELSSAHPKQHQTQQQSQQPQNINHLHLQQHQQSQPQSQQHQHQAPQFQHPWFTMSPLIPRHSYTGVDKLILAAMMDDSASNGSSNTTTMLHVQHQHEQHQQQLSFPQNQPPPPPPPPPAAAAAQQPHNAYIPCGRGIGYLNMRDVAMEIPTPSNKSELELYRLLDRANLLAYYGTFLSFGGDDVQQLSDADEDEFLEIMSLVGMTRKPLHVRRMQKALIDWRDTRGSESAFKRPNSNYFNLHHRETNSVYSTGDSRRNPSPDPSLLVESPATTPNSFKSTSITTPESKRSAAHRHHHQQQQCPLPHEVLIGAPKRPRLMDNIMTENMPKVGSEDPSETTNDDRQQQQKQRNRDQSWE